MGWLEQVFAAKPHIIQLIGRSHLSLSLQELHESGRYPEPPADIPEALQAMLLGGRFALTPWSRLPTLRPLCPGPASYDRC